MLEAFNRGWKHGHLTEAARLRHGLRRSLQISGKLIEREDLYHPHTGGESLANLFGMALGNIHAVTTGLSGAIWESIAKDRYPTEIVVPPEMLNKDK